MLIRMHIVQGCFWATMAELNNCDIKGCTVYYLVLYRKRSLTSDVEEYPLLVVLKYKRESLPFGMALGGPVGLLRSLPHLHPVLYWTHFGLNACRHLSSLMHWFLLGQSSCWPVFLTLPSSATPPLPWETNPGVFSAFKTHSLAFINIWLSNHLLFSALASISFWLLLEKFTQLGQLVIQLHSWSLTSARNSVLNSYVTPCWLLSKYISRLPRLNFLISFTFFLHFTTPVPFLAIWKWTCF